MIFQTLDDKSECVGVYVDGKLHFDGIPDDLTKTWRYTGSVKDDAVEYAWLYCGGKDLQQACPDALKEQLNEVQKTFKAYLKSFQIAKINLRDNCFFDLVPTDFLMEFCEVRNKITQHVFDTNSRPENYDHLDRAYKLLHKIKYQKLNINVDGCRHLMSTTSDREDIRMLVKKKSHYVDYNLFGTVTGRLTTRRDSNPILTMKSKFRELIKPTNSWFMSLDYNGAEIRTFLGLSGHEQPEEDIHKWNMTHLYGGSPIDREEAKVRFFSSFYNHNDNSLDGSVYSRKQVMDKYYDGSKVKTPFGRTIEVDDRRAFNYVIQSTTADLTIDRAIELDKVLNGCKTKVAFIIHDEIVLDVHAEDRYKIPELKEVFQNTKLGRFRANVKAGKNYGMMKEIEL
jgi:DNA polymerase I-like protein with 3'-5' exonuclease and polymerase domains